MYRSWVVVVLLCLAGCEQARFGFPPGHRFSIPDVPTGTPAAACFDELAAADGRARRDLADGPSAVELGSLSQQRLRRQERQRRLEWDQHYCRRQAECRILHDTTAPATAIAASVELCLDDRAQQRVP